MRSSTLGDVLRVCGTCALWSEGIKSLVSSHYCKATGEPQRATDTPLLCPGWRKRETA